MIRVLVVDDSAFMRNTIISLLEQDSDIKVAGYARDGQEALQRAEELDPDVVTLDVEMPRLDGLGALQRLMKKTPLPVLMVSSLTESGAESTLKALESGALDFIPKTMSHDRENFGVELRRKVKALARRKTIIKLKYRRLNHIQVPVPRPQPSQPVDYVQTPCPGPRDLVVIGVSTGGPPVVQKILSALPADFPACILVAQHMRRQKRWQRSRPNRSRYVTAPLVILQKTARFSACQRLRRHFRQRCRTNGAAPQAHADAATGRAFGV